MEHGISLVSSSFQLTQTGPHPFAVLALIPNQYPSWLFKIALCDLWHWYIVTFRLHWLCQGITCLSVVNMLASNFCDFVMLQIKANTSVLSWMQWGTNPPTKIPPWYFNPHPHLPLCPNVFNFLTTIWLDAKNMER